MQELEMANKDYDKARELTEKALDAYVDDDQDKGDKLVEQAKSVDKTAVEDVNSELEEDASSEHDPSKLQDQVGKSGQR
jgi:hypothetical protein